MSVVERKSFIQEAIEEAADLGEHFPDALDSTVLEHVSLVLRREIHENSTLGIAVIYAYDHGREAAIERYFDDCVS